MAELKTVHKWVWVWNFDKEERWLNEMATSGWALSDVGFCRYTFEKCEPGAYTVRLEMHNKDENYLGFMSETGAEYLGRVFAWIYFRKKTAEGGFDIFSDVDSRIAHLNRIGKMLSILGGLNLAIGILNSFSPNHAGWINLLCVTVIMYALGRIHGKKETLTAERQLHE